MPWGCARSTARDLERLIGQWIPSEAPEVAPSAPTEPSLALNAQALLDPHSELSKQLKGLGWIPPASSAAPVPVLPSAPTPPFSFEVSRVFEYAELRSLSALPLQNFDSPPLPLPVPAPQHQTPYFSSATSPSDFSSFHNVASSWPQPPPASDFGGLAQHHHPTFPSSGDSTSDPFASVSTSLPDPFADASMLALFESQAAYGIPVAGGWAAAGYGGVGLGQQPQWEGFAGTWDQSGGGGAM